MTKYELAKLKALANVLRETAKEYPHHSLANVIQQIESRINEQIKPET